MPAQNAQTDRFHFTFELYRTEVLRRFKTAIPAEVVSRLSTTSYRISKTIRPKNFGYELRLSEAVRAVGSVWRNCAVEDLLGVALDRQPPTRTGKIYALGTEFRDSSGRIRYPYYRVQSDNSLVCSLEPYDAMLHIEDIVLVWK